MGLISPENITFGADSLYADVEYKIKKRTAQHVKTLMTPEMLQSRLSPRFWAPVTPATSGKAQVPLWFGFSTQLGFGRCSIRQ